MNDFGNLLQKARVAGIRYELVKNGSVVAEEGDYTKRQCGDWSGIFSSTYNTLFNSETGEFIRWGLDFEDDPNYAPAPELADIEISEGDCTGKCPWCYKSNPVHSGKHMTLETFKQVLDRFPSVLTQVALGLTDLDANPDLLDIMRYCRERGVVPNFTTSGYGATPELIHETAQLAGAVAVSVYPHTQALAYQTISQYRAEGLEQTNMHLLYHADNMPFVYSVLHDIEMGYVNPRAVVLLGLKPKGRGSDMRPLPPEEFTKLVGYCFEHKLPIGFDSCSATKFLKALDDLGIEDKEQIAQYVEPCESGLFSIYVNRAARVFPCSFTEDTFFGEGIDLLAVDNFDEVWWHDSMVSWADNLLNNCRACPVYNID